MFDSFYPFYGLGFLKSELADVEGIKLYGFKTASFRYIVEIECYPYDFYVIQYYTANHKNHPKKFQILTHEHKCRKIVGTCVKIMHSIWLKNPQASFGFIGANTYNPVTKKEEKVDNTKRWRIYSYAMENHFGTNTFTHGSQVHNSSYVLFNKLKDIEKLSAQITSLFNRFYVKQSD